ncbi:hypothetical protein Tco_0857592 [Tanacetum coccineum]|uniref:Uncharacterized protein n=1 Tax=Tanacetum coccineum TaxID=301880 RepID=A0ABQ5B6U9_9ASTR
MKTLNVTNVAKKEVVSNDEERKITQVNGSDGSLADDVLTVGMGDARNGECVDIPVKSYYYLLRVNAAGTKSQLLKVTTAERLQMQKDKDCLKIKITYEIRIVIYRIDL